MTLPAHATDTSRKRYQLAAQLVQSCPPELGEEIALTGSTARGWADDESDLELNFWCESLPVVEERVAWLEAAGVEELEVFEKPHPDNSYWIGGRIDDVTLEVGWQEYTVMEALVSNVLLGVQSQVLGDIFAHAIPLKTQGKLLQWQERLREYPNAVQKRWIDHALGLFSTDEAEETIRLAQRGERLSVLKFLGDNLNAMMALLYAINRRWKPSHKWTLTVAGKFPLMPERWRKRMDDILAAPPEEGIYLCIDLMLDALALVPPEYDVSAAVAALQEAKQSAERRSP